MAGKRNLDWERIEQEYRAGVLSVAEIARRHECSRTAIQKRADKHKWTRDLTQKVKQRTQEKLVAPEVAAANAEETVERFSDEVAGVVRTHRKDIGALRQECSSLLAELQQFAKDAAKDDPSLRVKLFGARSQTLRDLSTSMSKLIPLERQAFGLDPRGVGEEDDGPRSLTDEELDAELAKFEQ